MSAATAGPVAVFGGTFNPIHLGHLRSAVELRERLALQEVRLMPAALPPHREAPRVSAADRAAMVDIAIGDEPGLICDRRELARSGPSYSYDSLAELRGELGDSVSLSLVMGADALLGLPRWYRWRELLDLAHLVILARPGWSLPEGGELSDLLASRTVSPDTLRNRAAGGLISLALTPHDISATAVRSLLQSGASAHDLLPAGVPEYIQQHQLYQ